MSDPIKPGDLVIVIGASTPYDDGNAGRTGSVKRHLSPGVYRDVFNGVETIIDTPCWLVEASNSFNQIIVDTLGFTRRVKDLHKAVFCTHRLRKIGGPSVDTTDTTSKPVKEIA
jgi:hypothetical protein